MTPVDFRALRASDIVTLRTRHGDLDLLAHPGPGLEFASLASRAEKAEILGVTVTVASLDDLIAMKREEIDRREAR
jgi:hypothetical protein